MDKLTDYVLWMADFPIAATGMRDADALVLSALSYFDWSCAFADVSGPKKLRNCSCMLENASDRVMITGPADGYPELLSACIESKRFGDLTLSNYTNIARKDPPMQFSAICFSVDPDISFLAFRGTDNSLAGWKEDFMISFTHTEAQIEALRYASALITPDRKWYIGGHSKGGYLALYVGCTLDEAQLCAVRRIYTLDGPGFCPDVLDTGLLKRVDNCVTRVIPGYSVVGKLFEPEIKDTHIVMSGEKGFLQHNLISWAIDHGKIAELEANDPESMQIDQVIGEWIGAMSLEDRTVFVNELFEALSAGGAETVSAISKGGGAGILAILRKLSDSGAITKNALVDFIKYLMHAKFDGFRRKFDEDQNVQSNSDNIEDTPQTLRGGTE